MVNAYTSGGLWRLRLKLDYDDYDRIKGLGPCRRHCAQPDRLVTEPFEWSERPRAVNFTSIRALVGAIGVQSGLALVLPLPAICPPALGLSKFRTLA